MEYKKDGEEPSGISMPNSEVSNCIIITNYGTMFIDENFAKKYDLKFDNDVLKIIDMQHEAPAGNNMENTPVRNTRERNEERFHFVHPEIEDEEAWHTHDSVKRLVVNYRMPDICAFLKDKNQDRKLLLPSNPSFVYLELVRMGMPTGEGFSEKNFSNNYVR